MESTNKQKGPVHCKGTLADVPLQVTVFLWPTRKWSTACQHPVSRREPKGAQQIAPKQRTESDDFAQCGQTRSRPDSATRTLFACSTLARWPLLRRAVGPAHVPSPCSV